MKWHNALAIINPRAGRWGSEKAAPRLLREACAQHGTKLTIRVVSGAQDARIWAVHAAQDGFDLLIVSGGDGTVHAAVNGCLHGKPIPMAILPTGSGNVLANELHIPKNLKNAVEIIHTGDIHTLDIGALTSHDRFFTNALSLGYGSSIIADARQELKNLFGFPAYILTALKHLIRIQTAQFRCKVDGVEYAFNAQMVIVANVSLESLKLRNVGPAVASDDGMLDVIVFSHKNIRDLVTLIADLLLWTRKPPRLSTFRGKTLTIESRPVLPLLVDGEICESGPVCITVRPRAIKILAPRMTA